MSVRQFLEYVRMMGDVLIWRGAIYAIVLTSTLAQTVKQKVHKNIVSSRLEYNYYIT